MEIDKKTIKALSADTRLEILRALKSRRKMPSELSKELKLSAPTVIEHLKKLEAVGLVEKQERGAKWIYYDLTAKGRGVSEPKTPVQFVLMLALSVILFIGGMINITVSNRSGFLAESVAQGTSKMATAAEPVIKINWIAVAIVIIGLALFFYTLFRIRKH